jgi:hypothetical protein
VAYGCRRRIAFRSKLKNKHQWINQWKGRVRRLAAVPFVRRMATPLVFVRRLVRPPKTPLCKVEGIERNSQLPFSILCGASGHNKNFLLDLVFDGSTRESDLGSVRLRDVFRAHHAAKKDCSLVVVETKQSHHAWLNTGSWFFIPEWVQGEIRLPVPAKFLNDNSVKNDLRKIRRHGFEYEVTQDEEHFDDFYHNMHVPYVSKVYGSAVLFDSYAEKRRLCGDFDLLLTKKRGQPGRHLAGELILYEPAGPRLWSLGVRDGDRQLVREGVLAALYHFSFQHLEARGFTRLHLGSCRAFLHDGVLKYKSRLSQSIIGSSWKGFALKILSDTPATRAFLLNNPFIFESNGALNGAVFVDSALSLETIQRIDKDCFHPGLSRLVIYSFQPGETAKPDNLPPELAGRIVIRPANEVIGR